MRSVITASTLLVLATSLVAATGAPRARLSDLDLIAALGRPVPAFSGWRRLEAGSQKLGVAGWMDVRVAHDPARGFKYEIVAEGGSPRVRNKALRPVIDGESQQQNERALTALTPANYAFAVERMPGQVRIWLTPRRVDSRLVKGVAYLTPDGELRRVEGQLAKSPSFWVRSAVMVREYRRVAGLVMPSSLESVADVRFAGMSRLVMTYAYEQVNGALVNVALPRPGLFTPAPSPTIMAVRTSFGL
jgi:hypothetical protein